MIFIPLYAVFSLLSLIVADAAPRCRDSPPNTIYEAYFTKDIMGSVKFSSLFGFILVRVSIEKLPSAGSDTFDYDIFTTPIPDTGECDQVGDMLNPYNGDREASGRANKPVGDLSGKHGSMKGPSYTWIYIDAFLSTNIYNKAYVGEHPIAVQKNGKETIACANIIYVGRPAVRGSTKLTTPKEDSDSVGPVKKEVRDGGDEFVAAYYANDTRNLDYANAHVPAFDAVESSVLM